MKILHFVHSLKTEFGGPAKSALELNDMLNASGEVSRVITLEAPTEVESAPSVLVFPTKYPRINRIRLSTAFLTQTKELIQWADVVHVHSMWSFPATVICLRCIALGKPYIISPRSNLYRAALARRKFKKALALFFYQAKLLNAAARIHVTDAAEEAEVLTVFPHLITATVPNALSMSLYERKQKPEKKEKVTKLLFLSRVEPRKNLLALVKAWARIGSGCLILQVAGPIEDSDYYQAVIAAVPPALKKHFQYMGIVSGQEKKDVLSEADFLCAPSDYENFGHSIAEAFAARLPVLVGPNTPWENLLESGGGIRVATGSDDILEGLCSALALSPDEIGVMVDKAYDYISRFDWSNLIKNYINMYRDVVSESPVNNK